ncbi:MAG: hypothetical protein JXA07_11255 [Spirochaetes bacterium]|nr:hypothetical protein [Spirochaetota bacterium]
MIIIILFLVLFVSLALHLSYLVRYIQTRNQELLQKYILTTICNVFLSGALIFVALYKPDQIQRIKFPLMMWLLNGFIMVLMFLSQMVIARRIYQRSKMPENYHYNFFGKKVLHPGVVKPTEVAAFFASIPLFLFTGAYFIAKLIRFFI